MRVWERGHSAYGSTSQHVWRRGLLARRLGPRLPWCRGTRETSARDAHSSACHKPLPRSLAASA
eukprot:12185822-Alexandrium_andersonii.AAC.1